MIIKITNRDDLTGVSFHDDSGRTLVPPPLTQKELNAIVNFAVALSREVWERVGHNEDPRWDRFELAGVEIPLSSPDAPPIIKALFEIPGEPVNTTIKIMVSADEMEVFGPVFRLTVGKWR